jgi:uncharacterized coiled-coil protein SlyX
MKAKEMEEKEQKYQWDKAMKDKVDTLTAQLAEAKKEVDRQAGFVSHFIKELACANEKLAAAKKEAGEAKKEFESQCKITEMIIKERTELSKMVYKVKKDRDSLRKQVEELREKCIGNHGMADEVMEKHISKMREK